MLFEKSNQLGHMCDPEIPHSFESSKLGNQTRIDGPLAGSVDAIVTTYDGFDNPVQIVDPNLGTWTYKYNSLGQLRKYKDIRFLEK